MYFVFAGIAILALVGVSFLLRTRRFYFIRHGETILNQKHVHQGDEGLLSENGRRQAEETGAVLKSLPITLIISSPYPRAKETAEIIKSHLKVPIMYSPLLAERRSPKEIIGKNIDDPESIRIIDQIDLAYHKDDYRFSDEENFIDLKNRARKCLTFLARTGASENAVVTHHVILKMILSYMLYRENLHADAYIKLSFFNPADNASITVCEFHPWQLFSATHGWEVVSYNQQAHV